MFVLQTVAEFSVGGFIIWGIINEDKMVDFEDRIIARIKKRIAVRRETRMNCASTRIYRT